MTNRGQSGQERLRVSVATLARVVFPHPQSGEEMLALERKATVVHKGESRVRVRAQPFGGGVQIRSLAPLQALVGEVVFDSERSQHERDFRLLIRPNDWDIVRRFCVQHLGDADETVLESAPHRELREEFADTLTVALKPEQYTLHPAGIVIENQPMPTDNVYARGHPTVRLYRVFEARVVDPQLQQVILTANQLFRDDDLRTLALADQQAGGKGRANAILTLPLEVVASAYLALPVEKRFKALTVSGHQLDVSVLAILNGVEVAQYQRI